MKNLLITTALVGFAGAAAADGHLGVTFTGSAELGYNDTNQFVTGTGDSDGVANDNDGFYTDLDITVGFAAELDNGLVAAASVDLDDFADGGAAASEYELSLTNETSGLYYGDTNFAAQNVWVAAGDMEADGFSEADGETALRGEATFGNVSAQMSYVTGFGSIDLAENADGTDADGDLNNDDDTRVGAALDDLEQLSVGVSADFGNVNVVLAYQEGIAAAKRETQVQADGTSADAVNNNNDFNVEEVFGLSVGTSFSGADIRLAYAESNGEDSTGISVAYPVGPVTATAYYVVESAAAGDNWGLNLAYENGPVAVTFDYQDDQGVEKIGLEGSYDVGNGLMVFAGFLTEDGADDAVYVGGEYDLGSGASLLVSYADKDDENDDDDDIGAQGYQVGTTVELSFEF